MRDYWFNIEKKTAGKATETTNQIKTFYTASEKAMWITFYQRKLWWCFADKNVNELADGSRIRNTLRPWSCKDFFGKDLHVDCLGGALTKVQMFQGTICKVKESDYLLRRLNGDYPDEVRATEGSLQQLEADVKKLIHLLGWKDFEILCDLIFRHAGWQRLSRLGKDEKTIDMELVEPVTDKHAHVQIKFEADLKTFNEYKHQFEELNSDAQAYFVVFQPKHGLEKYQSDESVILLTGERLAKLVVSAGLTRWLIQKTS